MKWNSNLYDKKHDFVAEYGKGLLEFIPENPNQKILDLGCGTGTLTTQLTNFAGTVVGVDSSYDMIEKAFEKCSKKLGFKYKAKFNFPTPEIFEKTLKDNDFRIDRVYAYDRPTVLKDEEQGLANWMKQFFASELEQMSKENQEQILKMVEDVTREKLWNGKEWVADYRRLRAIAYKR